MYAEYKAQRPPPPPDLIGDVGRVLGIVSGSSEWSV